MYAILRKELCYRKPYDAIAKIKQPDIKQTFLKQKRTDFKHQL